MGTSLRYGCDERGYINFVEGLVIKDPRSKNSYKLMRQIGKGTFSRVMQCEDILKSQMHQKKRLVAVKINRNVDKYQQAALIEHEILNAIKSFDKKNDSNCAHLTHAFDYHGHKCFVFPLYGRSVYGFLSSNKYTPFATPHMKQFSWQIIHAVKFMHDCKIIFTDLKPENIVFVKDRTVKRAIAQSLTVEIPTDTRLKVIDFGSALFEARWHNHLVQTRHYRAPEVVLGMKWSFPIDIWSIGCIMLEFIYGRMVFNTHDSVDHLNQMKTMIGPMPDNIKKAIPEEVMKAYYHKNGKLRLEKAKISAVHCQPLRKYLGKSAEDQEMLDLVSKMLQWDPKKRITANDALCHPFFRTVETSGLNPKKSEYPTRL